MNFRKDNIFCPVFSGLSENDKRNTDTESYKTMIIMVIYCTKIINIVNS